MSGKKNMKSKQQSMVDNSSDSKSAEVLSATASAPASTPASTAAPVSSVQKGGRSKKTAPATAVVNATAVVPVPTAATLATTSVVEQTQKGGRKKPSSAPVEASSSDNKTSARGSKAKSVQDKVSKESKESKESNDSTESKVPAVKPKVPKVPRKKKPENDAAPSAPDASVLATDVDSNEKHIRSFKVRLPGSETFEGRFTGLTPYQAANKALSKYFREGERNDNYVTFSICESTRKSKKSVYTYVGKRHKLDVPVKYSIQDGREIVKNFKNTLKKVKKSDNGSTQLATETSVSMAH